MTDNEKLIEEIATNAANSVGGYARPGYATYDAAERAARAAFEKAHTPTEDERAARAIVRRAVGGVLFHVTNFPERAQLHLFGENMGPLNEKITGAVLDALRRTEVPEPSAHRCEECQTCGVHDGRHRKCCGCYDGVCCQETQGEPSDAQVDAALDAFHGRSDWSNVADVGRMRAALRAAGGVR